MISDLSGRIQASDNAVQQIYKAFYDVGMIEETPDVQRALKLTIYDELAFSNIGSALILLKNTINHLVDIFNEYHFVDMDGDKVTGIEYWGTNESGISGAYKGFDTTLVQIENTIESMTEIMILNGLMKGNN
ncbi:hypothetical protein SOP56_02625 [Weissella confusa]|uniref:hypothetical protein n=3 Tax=Weissella confusa TaxID=1583 RepID=UPI002A766468|nr:hypothetical protein [Weissella confusa]MDY2528752.1 hypothetical protein [Weissella confusa]